MIKKWLAVLALVSPILLIAGNIGFISLSEEECRITNIRIYKNTPVWELAKAVKSQNINKIREIAKNAPGILDYQDPQYGTTLLFWSVGMEKYNSAEALLQAGANPDIISTYEGGTALYRAAGYSFIDNQAKKDPKFVKLLLQFGADPNIGFVGNAHNNSTEIGTSPLMNSIFSGIEKTKALVEGGAHINYQTLSGKTATSEALEWGGENVLLEGREYAYYLIVEKKADITIPYYRKPYRPVDAPLEKKYCVDLLRHWVVDLDSKDYRIKMEIVEEFARQGVNYRDTEIPKHIIDKIQKLYPDTWEEYIKVY